MKLRRAVARVTLLAFLGSLPGGPTLAELVGEEFVHGAGQVERSGPITTIRVPESSILRAQILNVGAEEALLIQQPSEGSRLLIPVWGGDPSVIAGLIQAQGSVYIANPSGVYFEGRPVIDVGKLAAVAGQLAEADFLAGRDQFSALAGRVSNTGQIRATGDLALVGASVENRGEILAPEGLVALLAGDRVLLARLDGHLRVEVERSAPAGGGAGGDGSGWGGLATGDLYSLAINHSGITRAREIHAEGGDGVVRVAGTLDASAAAPGRRGGRIAVTGELVALEGATLDASGDAGGGEIRVGGDARGRGPLANARRTAIDADSVLRADARASGDGGSAVVYAEEASGFFGRLSARGAGPGGDGGQAEISGAQLVSRGAIDLAAPQGERGTLHYDPREILIRGGSADGSDSLAPDPDPDRLTGDTAIPQSVRILFSEVAAEPFEIFESEIEGSDANLVLEALHRIAATGSFTHDADGSGDLDLGETLLLADGRSLTLRTRNDSGDGAGASSPNAGIDLRGDLGLLVRTTGGGSIRLATGDDGSGAGGSDAGTSADLSVARLQTAGGDVALGTKRGAIRADSIDTRGSAGAGRDGGAVSLIAGSASAPGNLVSAGIQVSGGITTRGADEAAGSGGAGGDLALDSRGNGDLSVAGAIDTRGGSGTSSGGAGGDVDLDTRNGGIALASIDSSGGDASAGDGGAAGQAVADAAAVAGGASLAVTGAIRVRGGAGGSDTTSRGGDSNTVRMRSADGSAEVAAIDASGGSGNERGGAGGAVSVNGGGGVATLRGQLVSLAGGGVAAGGASGSVRLLSASRIDDLTLSGLPVHSDGDVTLDAPILGSPAAPLRIDANGAVDSSLSLVADGDAFVEVVRRGFSAFDITQRDPGSDVTLTQEGGDLVAGTGRDASTHALTADTRANGVALAYRVGAPVGQPPAPASGIRAADLVIPIDGLALGDDGFLEATRDIALGEGASGGTAIRMAAGSRLTLFADLDKDADDVGRVRDGVAGAAAGEIETGGPTSSVQLSAGDGIGAAGDPVALRGGAILSAVTERNDLALENRGSGALVLRDLAHAHPVQLRSLVAGTPGRSVEVQSSASGGDLSLANLAGGARIEATLGTPSLLATSAVDLAVAPGSTLDFAVAPSGGVDGVSAGGDIRIEGDILAERDAELFSNSGDIDLMGSIDAAAAGAASLAAAAPAGTTRFGDGVGGDRIGSSAALSNLNGATGGNASTEFRVASVATEGALRSLGATRIQGAETRFDSGSGAVRFEGTLDGPGSAVIARADGGVVFEGDVGSLAPLAQLETNSAGLVEFRGARVIAGSGGIALNPLGRADIPARATLFKQGGDLAFATTGGFGMGRGEKLSVAGALGIAAASAVLGDLNALSIDVESTSIALFGRPAADLELRSGAARRDTGLDLVANSIRFSSTPIQGGVGAPVRIYTAAGSVRPQPIPGAELRLIDAAASRLSAASFAPASGAGLLDLSGEGPPSSDDPAAQIPRLGPPAPTGRPPQFSQDAIAAELPSDPAPILSALRAPLENLPPPALPRALAARVDQAARAYAAFFGAGTAQQAALRAFRSAAVASGDRSGAGLRRAVEGAPDPAAARRYLSQLGELLTELRLLEVSPEVAAALRAHVLERALDAVDVGGLDAAALGSAADPESPGFRL